MLLDIFADEPRVARDTMCKDWSRIIDLAAQNGYALSFESVGDVLACSQAYLLTCKRAPSAEQLRTWLSDAFCSDAIVCPLTSTLCASDLKDAKVSIFEHFRLSPKAFCDTVRAACLLAKMRVYAPASVTKLFWLSGLSCYAVFKAFLRRVFDMTPAEVFASPDVALGALEQRLPQVAAAMVEHFAMRLSSRMTTQNDASAFLVFLRKKPTQKINLGNQLRKSTQKILDRKRIRK